MTHSPAPAAPHKGAILAIILVSYVMIVLDTSIVLTGLPNMHRDLGFTDAGLAWVQSAYTLTFGGFLLLAARAGDIVGRRFMLIAGLALFTVASVAIGLATAPGWMIAARAVQGLGAAILAPSTLALLQTTFAEGHERTRAVSYYSAMAGIAASVGLVLGGVLAEWLSWRVGFFINLPIGLVMMWAARRYITESARGKGKKGLFDLPGALTSTLGMGLLVYGFIRTADSGWADPLTLAALAAAVLLLATFVAIEKRAAQPIMPLRLFADRTRSTAYAARFLFLAAMIGFFFFTTQYLQVARGYSAALTGLAFLPTTLPNFVVAMRMAGLARRFGNARLLALGLGSCLLGMAWLSRATGDSGFLISVALPMALIGIGQGLVLSPLTAFGISGVARDDAGAASGVVNVAHQIGSALGLAVLISVAALGGEQLAGGALLAHRVTMALTTSACLLGAALLLVWFGIVRPASGATKLAHS